MCVSACVCTELFIGGRMAAVAGGAERRPHMGSRPTIDTHSIFACINTFCLSCQLSSNRVKCSWLEEGKHHQKTSLHLIIDGRQYVSRCSVCCVSVCVFICTRDVLCKALSLFICSSFLWLIFEIYQAIYLCHPWSLSGEQYPETHTVICWLALKPF